RPESCSHFFQRTLLIGKTDRFLQQNRANPVFVALPGWRILRSARCAFQSETAGNPAVRPMGDHVLAAGVICLATYGILGIQAIPRIHIDRPSGALLGAVAMVVFGVVPLEQAYRAIDLDTILFLLGMMILIAYLELSGFFEVLERWIIGRAR